MKSALEFWVFGFNRLGGDFGAPGRSDFLGMRGGWGVFDCALGMCGDFLVYWVNLLQVDMVFCGRKVCL